MTECNFADSFEVTRAAAENWHRNKRKRKRQTKAIEKKNYMATASPVELAEHANQLISETAKSVGGMKRLPPSLQELAASNITADNVTDATLERVIGETSDFLSVAFLAQASDAIRSVGRIAVRLPNGNNWVGTGFLVTDQLMMTNHHVLKDAFQARHARIEFDFQLDENFDAMPRRPFQLDPGTFFHTNEQLDYALVAVAPTPLSGGQLRDYDSVELNPNANAPVAGQFLNIVQHPRGEVKQIVIRENKLLDLPADPDFAVHYLGDTHPGSSGSPVFNDRWQVEALHHSGVPDTNDNGEWLDINGQVWQRGFNAAPVKWIANEGIRISKILEHLRRTVAGAPARELIASLIRPIGNGPTETRETLDENNSGDTNTIVQAVAGQNTAAVINTNGDIQLTVPLTITVSLGGAASNGITLDATQSTNNETPLSLRERATSPAELDLRDGYDSHFLGVPAPLPVLPLDMMKRAAIVRKDGGSLLHYEHFTTIMNGPRRLAFFSAGNLDPLAPIKQKRKDAFTGDPRVEDHFQADNSFYRLNDLDRGHLWRREAGAWGQSEAEARNGNNDSYYWTNIAPQHKVFNQSGLAKSKGLQLWGNLENLIADQAARSQQRVSVFCGPVFRRNDRFHRGLKIPSRYWKIVMFINDHGNPAAVGFVLSQASLIRDLSRESQPMDFMDFELFQEPVSAISEMTSLDFGVVEHFDGVNDRDGQSASESTRHIERRIRSVDDIVF